MKSSVEKTALVVIDVQNCFINKYTKILPSKIAHYLLVNGRKFDLIVFSAFVNNKKSIFYKTLQYKKCLKRPDIDIHPVLIELSHKAKIFKRTSYSIFRVESFVKLLSKHKIKKVLLCGIDIDACVIASAFDGIDMGYKVYILKNLSLSSAGRVLNKAASIIIKRNLLVYE